MWRLAATLALLAALAHGSTPADHPPTESAPAAAGSDSPAAETRPNERALPLEPALAPEARPTDPDADSQRPLNTWLYTVETPVFYPPGGVYPSDVCVSIKSATPRAVVHYSLNGSDPTAGYDYLAVGDCVVVSGPQVLRAIAIRPYWFSSAVVDQHYEPAAPEYGVMVPFHHRFGYSGIVARVRLLMEEQPRPLPAVRQEFANWFTHWGMGPYEAQVHTLDLERVHGWLRGFQGGFHARHVNYTVADDVVVRNYATLVPFHTGSRHSGLAVRVDVDAFAGENCSALVLAPADVPEVESTVAHYWDACVTVLNLTAAAGGDWRVAGFAGGFAGEDAFGAAHSYFVPTRRGVVARAHSNNFTTAGVQLLDLESVDPALQGFRGGAAAAGYGWLAPFWNRQGPVGGINSEMRVDADQLTPHCNSKLVRFNLTEFSAESVEVLDLVEATGDERACGFVDAFQVGHRLYLVPYENKAGYSGLLTRVDMVDFATVDTLDLTAGGNSSLKGFIGGFHVGDYAFLVPKRNGEEDAAGGAQGGRGFGTVVRVDVHDFSLDTVETIDLPTAERAQIPPRPDKDLRGFSGGFVSGDYGYFVPEYSGLRGGKIARINVHTMDDLQILDLQQQNATLGGFGGGFGC